MAQRLFGIETEYGLSVIPTPGSTCDNENSARELLGLATTRFAQVPGLRSSGLFLGNGSRFYVDCGAHPELATPECTNPWDAVRYVQAGERLMLDLTGQLARRDRRIANIFLSKANVDYLSRATWGCHESYSHRVPDQGALSAQIIPHLVSRIVFCGAGGFDSLAPGIEFAISPRVPHLRAAVSGDSTNMRGIFHTRDEPLCGDGSRRLHILCGESLSGETGAWLKVATTALDEESDAGFAQQVSDGVTPELEYERTWALALLERVMARLREEYVKAERARLFETMQPHLSGAAGRPGYARLGEELGMSEGAVTVAMHRMRRRYGELLREEIVATVATPEEVEEELRHLMNVVAT